MTNELKWIEHALPDTCCCWYCFIFYNLGGATIELAMEKVTQ